MPNVNATSQAGVQLTTTNGDTTVAATFATRSNNAYIVKATILALKINELLGAADDYGAASSYGRVATFINDGGTLVQAAGTAALWTHEEGDADWGVDITPSGTNILVRVSGTPAETIRWRVQTEITEVGSNSAVPN